MNFIVARLDTAAILALGQALVNAAKAKLAKQQALDEAIAHVHAGVAKLTGQL